MGVIRVHIVESLTAADLSQQRTEGAMLSQSLRLAGVASEYSWVENLKDFALALSSLTMPLSEAGHVALHLSCHGDDRGIRLMSGETVSWYELRLMLVPINRKQLGRLLVCTSTCYGLFGAGMALDPNDTPFHAIVGAVTKVHYDDAAVAFIVFYHQFAKGMSVERAVDLMKLASGEENFGIVMGEPTRSAILGAIAEIGASNNES